MVSFSKVQTRISRGECDQVTDMARTATIATLRTCVSVLSGASRRMNICGLQRIQYLIKGTPIRSASSSVNFLPDKELVKMKENQESLKNIFSFHTVEGGSKLRRDCLF